MFKLWQMLDSESIYCALRSVYYADVATWVFFCGDQFYLEGVRYEMDKVFAVGS